MLPGVLSVTANTRSTIVPISGITLIKIHQPVQSMSWSPLMVTARLGRSTAYFFNASRCQLTRHPFSQALIPRRATSARCTVCRLQKKLTPGRRNWRYRKHATNTGGRGGWTGECFVDPTGGRLIEVRHNPETGERDYVEADRNHGDSDPDLGAEKSTRRSAD